MYPEIIRIGNWPITSFGLVAALSCAIGFWLIRARAVKYDIDVYEIENLCFLGVMFGLIGARLWYYFDLRDYYSQNPTEMLYFFRPGLTSFGGLVGGFITILIWVQRKKYHFLSIMDTIAPPAVLCLAFSRLGCLMYGCCFGLPVNNNEIWSVFLHSAHRYPTQIYDLVITATMVSMVWIVEKVIKKSALLPLGIPFSWSLFAYGSGRFISEFWRYNEPNDYVHLLSYYFSYAQVYAMGMMIFGLLGVFIFTYRRKN